MELPKAHGTDNFSDLMAKEASAAEIDEFIEIIGARFVSGFAEVVVRVSVCEAKRMVKARPSQKYEGSNVDAVTHLQLKEIEGGLVMIVEPEERMTRRKPGGPRRVPPEGVFAYAPRPRQGREDRRRS